MILTDDHKAEVMHSVSVELLMAFGVLENHYSRPQFSDSLSELEKVESYLKEKLLEYDPSVAEYLN